MLVPTKKFMELAIAEAKRGRRAGDYGIGAVLVKGNTVIARASSRSKRDESSLAHAETLVLLRGNKILKNRHLTGCVLYTTHEPCPMCSGAIVFARLKGVVYGARQGDMKRFRERHANRRFLWRTIDIPCRYIFRKSTEPIEVVSDFIRSDCIALFHND